MNHANALMFKPGLVAAELTLLPDKYPLFVAVTGRERLMPAPNIVPQYVNERKFMPVVVWVEADKVMRCGNEIS